MHFQLRKCPIITIKRALREHTGAFRAVIGAFEVVTGILRDVIKPLVHRRYNLQGYIVRIPRRFLFLQSFGKHKIQALFRKICFKMHMCIALNNSARLETINKITLKQTNIKIRVYNVD